MTGTQNTAGSCPAQDPDQPEWLSSALRTHADLAELTGPEPGAIVAEGRMRIRRRKAGLASAGAGGMAMAAAIGVIFTGGIGTTTPHGTIVTSEAGGARLASTASHAADTEAPAPASITIGSGIIDGTRWTVTQQYSKPGGWCGYLEFGEGKGTSLGCTLTLSPEPSTDVGKPWVGIVSTGTNNTLPCDLGVVEYRSADVASISMTATGTDLAVEKPVSQGGYDFSAFVAPLANADYTSTASNGTAGPAGNEVLSGMPGGGCAGE